MKRLILWRHGVTTWNAAGRFQGHEDVDLTDAGREQAAMAAVRLADLGPTAIVSSDLRRATQTAQALSSLTGLSIRLDQRLRERYFGPWQGLVRSEIIERWPDQFQGWLRGETLTGVDVESIDEVCKRAAEVTAEVAAEGETVVLATHGGTAKCLCQAVLGWPAEVTKTLKVLENCHWTELRHDSVRGWMLWAHNAN